MVRGSPGTPSWTCCLGSAGCSQGWCHPHGASPGWIVLASDLPAVAAMGTERLQCGHFHSSSKVRALHFIVLNMQVAMVSPDYLI